MKYPDMVMLEYHNGDVNKFYNIELNEGACEVLIEYGTISKNSRTDGEEFDNLKEAIKFYEAKINLKLKHGYIIK